VENYLTIKHNYKLVKKDSTAWISVSYVVFLCHVVLGCLCMAVNVTLIFCVVSKNDLNYKCCLHTQIKLHQWITYHSHIPGISTYAAFPSISLPLPCESPAVQLMVIIIWRCTETIPEKIQCLGAWGLKKQL
jgi:hypothetical protein